MCEKVVEEKNHLLEALLRNLETVLKSINLTSRAILVVHSFFFL